MSPVLLSVKNLRVRQRAAQGEAVTVDDLSFDLAAGEALGLVGESGSGKSQAALALMGLTGASARVEGRMHFDGDDLLTMPGAQRRRLRGSRMAMVFQDPMASLNPYLRIGVQLAEVLEVHRGATRAAAWMEAARALDAVRIAAPRERLSQYPHELSGGMRQRVMIAMAIIAGPALLIADEPTTALDPSVQLQILMLLDDLRREGRMALLLITHDLGVVAGFCERVLVMVAGSGVECGPTARLLSRPRHPYTAALLQARPGRGTAPGQPLQALAGQAPDPREYLQGCRFAARCAHAQPDCLDRPPPLIEAPQAWVRCGYPL